MEFWPRGRLLSRGVGCRWRGTRRAAAVVVRKRFVTEQDRVWGIVWSNYCRIRYCLRILTSVRLDAQRRYSQEAGGLDDREKGQLGWIVSKNGEAAAAVRMG